MKILFDKEEYLCYTYIDNRELTIKMIVDEVV